LPPILIVFAGLPGTGKTTIAKDLARHLGAVHLRIDSIEQAIRTSGAMAQRLNDTGYRVAYAVAEDNLRLGLSVISDSVNPVHLSRDAWMAVASRVQVPAAEVELRCSDLQEHRQRVEARVADISGLRLPTWQDVLSREYEPWNRKHIEVDTAGQSVAESVEGILQALAL
jgi:predicted kinase